MIPIGSAGRGLIALGTKEEPRWGLVDENKATITPLPGVDNLERAEFSDDRVLFVGGFNQEAFVSTTYAVLDIASGQVTPIATWFLVRRVGDAPYSVLVDLTTKKEKDLGPGYGGVWTVS